MKYKSKTKPEVGKIHRRLSDVYVDAEIVAIIQTDTGFIADGIYYVEGDTWQEPIRRTISDQEAQALASALGLSSDFIAQWRTFTGAACLYVLKNESGFGEFEVNVD